MRISLLGIDVIGKESSYGVEENSFKSTKSNESLTSYLSKEKKIDLYPVHRIDRNTRGLVLFAKDKETLNILNKKFQDHEIEKTYIAKCYGIPKRNEDVLNAYLFKDSVKSRVYISDVPKKGYLPIKTKYKVIEINEKDNLSVLEVQIETR